MQHTLTASLLVCLSEKGFSLDELVGKLREVLEQQAHGKILQMILLLVEETLRLKVMGKEEVPVACECGGTAFVLNGRQKSRRIRTSLGDLRLPALVRVKCTHCGKTHTLLLRFLGIERHQSKTSELEQQAIEQAVADSYRRAAGRLEQATGVRTPHSTLHGWVLDTKADQMDLPPDAMGACPRRWWRMAPSTKAREPSGETSKRSSALRRRASLCRWGRGQAGKVGGRSPTI